MNDCPDMPLIRQERYIVLKERKLKRKCKFRYYSNEIKKKIKTNFRIHTV